MSRIESLRRDFMGGSTIQKSLPVTLANGSVITEFQTQCSVCDKDSPDEHFRGNTYLMHDNNTFVMNGVGFCQKCMTLWPVNVRIKAHGKSFKQEFLNNQGVWFTNYAQHDYKKTHFKYWLNLVRQRLNLLVNKIDRN